MEVVGKTIIKYAGKKYSKKAVVMGFNSDDLYYETIVTKSRLGGMKEKKVKKRMPPGATPVEEALLKKAKKSAWRLDMSLINLMGCRFGWSAVVGIVPAFGDAIDFLLAVSVYKTCCELEPPLPQTKRHIMKLNMLVDALIGLIPILGDLADGVYKCNTRNVAILEAEIQKRGAARIGDMQAQADHAAVMEHEERVAHGGPPPDYASRTPNRPERAYTAPKSGGIRGWFGGRKQDDIEAGQGAAMTQYRRADASHSRSDRY